MAHSNAEILDFTLSFTAQFLQNSRFLGIVHTEKNICNLFIFVNSFELES